jgi:predicted  nucleic acid-binding Zn-ribbon protein
MKRSRFTSGDMTSLSDYPVIKGLVRATDFQLHDNQHSFNFIESALIELADVCNRGLAYDYTKLINLPTFDGQTWVGDLTGEHFGLAYQTSIVELGERIDVVDTRLGGIDTHLETIDTHLDTIDTHLAGIDENLIVLDTDVTTLKSDVVDIKSDIVNIKGNITTIEVDIVEVKGDITDIESNISTINAHLETLDDEVAAVYSKALQIDARVSVLDATVGGIQSDISTINTNISGITTNLNTLTTRVGTAEGNIKTLTTSLNTLTTRVGTAEGNIKTNATNISTNAANIKTLTTSLNTLTTRVGTAETNIKTNATAIANLKTAATSLTTSLNTLTTRVGTAETNIKTNTTSIDNATTRVTALEVNLQRVSGRVEHLEGDKKGFWRGTLRDLFGQQCENKSAGEWPINFKQFYDVTGLHPSGAYTVTIYDCFYGEYIGSKWMPDVDWYSWQNKNIRTFYVQIQFAASDFFGAQGVMVNARSNKEIYSKYFVPTAWMMNLNPDDFAGKVYSLYIQRIDGVKSDWYFPDFPDDPTFKIGNAYRIEIRCGVSNQFFSAVERQMHLDKHPIRKALVKAGSHIKRHLSKIGLCGVPTEPEVTIQYFDKKHNSKDKTDSEISTTFS